MTETTMDMNPTQNTATNVRSLLPNSIAAPGGVLRRNRIDATRGATRLGIGAHVFVDQELVDAYAELDPGLGQNVLGTILAVMATHLAGGKTLACNDVLPVDLRRREDGEPVEVQLRVRRFRSAGRECVALGCAGERPVVG